MKAARILLSCVDDDMSTTVHGGLAALLSTWGVFLRLGLNMGVANHGSMGLHQIKQGCMGFLHCVMCFGPYYSAVAFHLSLLHYTGFAALHCVCCITLGLLHYTGFAALHWVCCITLCLLHYTGFAALH